MHLRTVISLLVALSAGSCGRPAADEPAADAPVASPPDAEVPAVSTDFDPEPWHARGREIQQATFAALSGELRRAMEAGGVPEALEYCNVAAYPVTDSLATAFGVEIRRASRRPRNPDNRARPDEVEVLEGWEVTLAEGGEPGPVVRPAGDGAVHYYAPIRIQPLCLNCHGEIGTEVAPAAAALIAELYPDDQAVGYGEGDLRGAWSLRFAR